MRQAREIIRLKFSASVPTREIARRLGLAPSTVRETLKRLNGAGLVWPLPEGMSDGDLEAALYANTKTAGSPTGFWRMAGHPAVQKALRNSFFDQIGLPRLYVSA
jgi:predicted ArsR family transcriptional regulator